MLFTHPGGRRNDGEETLSQARKINIEQDWKYED